jgi:hypothetical protein
MNNRVESVSAHDFKHPLSVTGIDLVKSSVFGNRPKMSAIKRIDYGDPMPGVDQLMGGVRADISGSAGDENIERGRRQKAASLDFLKLYRELG